MKEILIAVISLIAGGFIGPYVNWGIEKRKQRLAYRKELIINWRKMIVEVCQDQKKALVQMNNAERGEWLNFDEHSFWQSLENRPEYHSLRQHLSLDAGKSINSVYDRIWDDDVAEVAQGIIDEIAKKEREWGLV